MVLVSDESREAAKRRRSEATPPVVWRGKPARPDKRHGGWRGPEGYHVLKTFIDNETRFRMHASIDSAALWTAFWSVHSLLARDAKRDKV